MGDVPFRDVYIHALVRDEKGQKMSKSKGNVIDPLEIIGEYGTDALRFTLSAMAAQGRDIKLAVNRVEGYRNFATKLWNAARYCQMNGCEPVAGYRPVGLTQTVNRWIVGELADAAKKVADAIDAYKFNEAANAAYQFTWGNFCDWYMEFTKPILAGTDEAAKAETRATTAWVLDQILHVLHPMMPFITEELWEQLSPSRANRLISAEWPEFGADLVDAAARDEMNWVVRLITSVRSMRSEMNVPPAAQIELKLKDAGAGSLARLDTHRDLILRMARLSSVEPLVGPTPKSAVQAVQDEATLVLPLEGIVDLDKERARLTKEIDKLAGEIKKIDAKLSNEQFVAKAPDEVIEEQRDRRAAADQARDKLQKALDMLSA
jgi:valyl-tRNA synthetase